MIEDAMIIAGDSYREATRRKGVVFLLLLIAVAQVAVFSLYEEISLGVSDKMLMDSGLAMVTLVGIMSSMGVVFQVPKELRDRTAMTLFAKPMGRESYLIGKFMGIGALCFRNMAFAALGILLVLNSNELTNKEFTLGFFNSFALALVCAIDLAAVGLLLSLFLSEGAAVLGVLVVLFLGNASYAWSVAPWGIATVASVMKYVLPNLYLFDIKSEVAANLKSSMNYSIWTAAYGLSYAMMLLSASIVIFKKRDL